MIKRALAAVALFTCHASAEVTVQGTVAETKEFVAKGQSQVVLRGKASMVVEAGTIKAEVALTSDGSTPGTALSLHEEQKKTLLSRLQAIGITRGQVTVPKFATLSPRYSAGGDRPIGHRADSTLTLEITEQIQYVELLALLDKFPQARLEGLRYDHSQLANIQKQVQATACKRVMTRKEGYEQGLGVTLRAVSFVDEEAGDKGDLADGSRFGQITIASSVQVTFEIDRNAPAPKPAETPAKPAGTP